MSPGTPHPRARASTLVAATSLVLVLLALTVLLATPQTWVRLGMARYLWFVVVIGLGLFAGAMTSMLTHWYATYSGKILGGVVKTGGPITVTFLVWLLGLVAVSAPVQQFDFSVLVQDATQPPNPPAELEPGAKLRLDLGADRREEAIGSKGEVRFVAIPVAQIGRSVPVSLVGSQRFEIAPAASAPAGQVPVLTLSEAAAYLNLRPRQISVPVQVLTEQGQPVPNARWHMTSLPTQHGQADEAGRFSLSLPANLPATDRELQVQADGYALWRGSVTPGAGPLTVQMVRQR